MGMALQSHPPKLPLPRDFWPLAACVVKAAGDSAITTDAATWSGSSGQSTPRVKDTSGFEASGRALTHEGRSLQPPPRRLPRRVALRFRRLTVSGSERGRGDSVARRSRFARDGHARRDHRLRLVCGHRRSCIVRDVERVARAGNRFLARLRCVNLRASRRDLHGGEVWRPSWTGLVKVRREPSSRPRSSAGFRPAVSSDA